VADDALRTKLAGFFAPTITSRRGLTVGKVVTAAEAGF